MVPFGWLRTLSTVISVLTLLVLLVGLIMTLIAYFRKGKSKIALLGMLGFLLMFLLSCCSLSWGMADRPIVNELPSRSVQTYYAVRGVVLSLLGLVNLAGIGLIIAAVWTGGKRG
jgi:hypothetical protein